MGKDIKGKELGEGLTQRKDGVYSARFRGKNGKRYEKYFSDLAEAKNWLVDARYKDQHDADSSEIMGHDVTATLRKGKCEAVTNPVVVDQNHMQAQNTGQAPVAVQTNNVMTGITVDTWFSHWMDDIKGDGIRPGTRNAYINRYNSRIKGVIGHMMLNEVMPMNCQMVIKLAQFDGESEWSLKKLRVIMKAFFEAALDNMLITSNPVTKTVKISKHDKKERRVLTKKEQDKFIMEAKKSAHYDEFRFILETGLRCGEMCGLLWENVDLENRKIVVEHSLEYRTDIHEYVNNPPKTLSSFRTIPLTNTAYDILVRQKEKQELLRIPEKYKGFVFLNRNGKPTHRAIYNRSLHEIAHRMGVDKFSMHSLRHSFATRAIEAGIRPKTLQKIMGHSNLSMTMDLYVHVTEEETFNEMKKLDNLSSDSNDSSVA